ERTGSVNGKKPVRKRSHTDHVTYGANVHAQSRSAGRPRSRMSRHASGTNASTAASRASRVIAAPARVARDRPSRWRRYVVNTSPVTTGSETRWGVPTQKNVYGTASTT